MPPKKAKANPEELKSQFEAWKNQEEFKFLEAIGEGFRQKDRITTTTADLPGAWQPLLDKMWDLFKVFKVKVGKLKALEQPFVRSFFFARQDTETEKVIIDGIHCGVTKELNDGCYFCRHRICDVIDNCKDNLDGLTPETYSAFRKEIQKKMQEFIKFYTPHVKNGHKVIYEQNMASVLRPLKELIDINYTYRSFQHAYITDGDKLIRDFKLKAIQEKYIRFMQEVMRILYEEVNSRNKEEDKDKPPQKVLVCTPDIRKMFYKINLKNWKNNEIEKMYLEPLQLRFKDLQKTLWRSWYDGENYWKIPLSKNTEIVENIQHIISAEIIAERLLGTPLRRDQLNFMFKVVSMINQADEMLRRNLTKKDENTVTKAIPILAVYKMIQHMRDWKDKKIEEEKRVSMLQEKMGELNQLKRDELEKSPVRQANRTFTSSQSILMQQTGGLQEEQKQGTESPKKDQKKKTMIKPQEDDEIELKKFQEDEAKYGRYWIFEILVDDKHKKIFELASEQIKLINKAVQQDIDDKIIKEGMKPKAKKTDLITKDAREYLDKKTEQDNADFNTIATRPPELWNYPKILEKHKFRTIADPERCYQDGRIQSFWENLEILSEHIQSNQKYMWNFLVDRIIDAFIEEEKFVNKDGKSVKVMVKKYNPAHDLPLNEFHFQAEKIKWKD